MKYHHRTLGYFVNLLSGDFRDRIAIKYKTEYRTERYTYGQILEYSEKLAEYLIQKGLKKGDKIILCCPNRVETVIAMMTAGLAGFILVPVDINSTESFIATVVKETEPDFIIRTELATSLFEKQDLQHDKVLLTEDLFETLRKIDGENFKSRDFFVSDSDVYEIIYTSGTTSNPKGVVLTHKNITGNLRSIRERLICKPSWNFLNILPLSHMFGQVLGLFYPFRFGCSVTLLEKMKPSLLTATIKEDNITIIVTVPGLLKMMKERILTRVEESRQTEKFFKTLHMAGKFPDWLKRFVFRNIYNRLGKDLTIFLSGGAHLPEDVNIFWENLGVKVLQGYGLTETSPVVTTSGLNDRKIGSVGKVLSRQEIKIADDGEILTCGENVFSGYYKRPELNSEIFENGWFKTGDIGEIDKMGDLFIRGRKKNMLLSASGINVYPEDIEEEILKNDFIKSTVVLGKNTDDNQLIISAVIIPQEGKNPDLSRLKSELNEKLLAHQRIDNIYLWKDDDFPRTHTLKIKRNLVAESLENTGFIPEEKKSSAESDDPVISLLSKLSGTEPDKITDSMSLSNDLGFDSLKIIEFIVTFEEKTGIQLGESNISGATTVEEIKTKAKENSTNLAHHDIIRWPLRVPARMLRSIIFGIFRIKFAAKIKKEVYGKDFLHDVTRPVIVVSNHQSHIDTPTILSCLPRSIRKKTAVAAAHDHFFEGKSNWQKAKYQLLLNIFPFHRKNNFSLNFKYVGKLLDKRWSVIIYPEGTRSRDGKMQSFKRGTGMLVKNMNVPVVPVKLEGLFELMPAGSTKMKSGNIAIKFGKPMYFKSSDNPDDITARMEDIVNSL